MHIELTLGSCVTITIVFLILFKSQGIFITISLFVLQLSFYFHIVSTMINAKTSEISFNLPTLHTRGSQMTLFSLLSSLQRLSGNLLRGVLLLFR